jgi:hypothetical protein
MRGQTSPQMSLGDGFIDPSLFELDNEVKRVDALVLQKEFLTSFEDVFSQTMGRLGTPMRGICVCNFSTIGRILQNLKTRPSNCRRYPCPDRIIVAGCSMLSRSDRLFL